jgi:hypothetical protein
MDDRQTFSVKRIEFIEDVNKGTFCNTEIDYSCCFQVAAVYIVFW